MFTIRNAWRNIRRARGRSLLIGILIIIIAFSVCIGLSIRQSSADARDAALSDLTVTATITPDRSKAAKKASGSDGTFDKSKLKEAMADSLSLTELKKYAKADSVKSFYYTLTASLDASGDLEAYSASDSSSDSSSSSSASSPSADSAKSGMAGGWRGGFGGMNSGDFTLTGYSSDEAMTDFTDGTCKITDGAMFEEGTDEMVCVISDELAEYNDLSVGDTITLKNPNNSKEKYKLKITGIYTNSASSSQAQAGGPGQMSDPANNIYTSYETLAAITSASAKTNSSDTSSAVTGRLNGTYVLGTVSAYEKFQTEASDLGLSDDYTVTSMDIENYERSAEPLENLAKFAGWFLLVILIVGAAILVIMNIFSTRERKYEIGVLTAIGMKRGQVARLFVTEILILTLIGACIGGIAGSFASAPVGKALLTSTAASQTSRQQDMRDSFGRENNGGGPGPQNQSYQSDEDSAQSGGGSSENSASASLMASTDSDSQETAQANVPAAPGSDTTVAANSLEGGMNPIVLLELLGACLLLAAAAGAVSVITILRYEPMQILTNRD